MDISADMLGIEKLCGQYYHMWKQKILLLLALHDVDHCLDEDALPDCADDSALKKWNRENRRARALHWSLLLR